MANLNLNTSGILPCRKSPPNAIIPYLSRWQQNNSPTDLGIVRFLFDLIHLNEAVGYLPLLKDFRTKYGVANWAKQALSQYYTWEEGMTKEDRCFAFATYREGSKTFWFSFFSQVYEILVGQYGIYYKDTLFPEVDYQVLRAKNAKEAKKRLMNISSFLNSPLIHDLFGNLKPSFQQVKLKDAKDSGELLILSNRYILEASGIDQPSRGLNIFQMRPKRFTFDDPQNIENTKTPGRRELCDKEVMEESFGAVADEGSIVYIANKTHTDDTLGKLLDPENTQWTKQFHTITAKVVDGKLYPGNGDLDNEVPTWKARWDIERVKKRREYFIRQPKLGGLRGFLKEYYNLITSDADYKLKYHEAEYLYEHGQNWLVFRSERGKEYVNCYIVVSNDPAISKEKNSSDAVISVTAFTPSYRRYVLEYSSGKFGISDTYYDESKAKGWANRVAVTPEETALIERKGNSAEVIRMYLKYHADAIVIETFGQQGTFFEVTQKKLNNGFHMFPTIMPHNKREGAKEEKLRELPLAYFEAGLYYIREDMVKLQAEIESFSAQSRKDHLDALYLAEQKAFFPQRIEYNPLGVGTAITDPLKELTSHEPAIKKGAQLTNDYESWITAG